MIRILFAVVVSAGLLWLQDDITGDWTIAGDVQGVAVDEVCSLVQTDSKLTGSCGLIGKKYDTAGSVDCKRVTFKHGGEYNGDPLTLPYMGVLGDDGGLSGSIDVQPMDVGGTFNAKKAAAAAAAK